MRNLIMLMTLMSLFLLNVKAYDFKYNGIRYSFVSTSDKTVEVAKGTQSAGADGVATYSGDITIPNTVTYNGIGYSVIGIGESAFVNCPGITSMKLPSTLQYIRKEAFTLCLSLKEITIPAKVYSIGYNVFSVSGISKITVESATPATVSYNAFYYPQSVNNCVLYVPYGSKSKYQSAAEWNKFKSIIEMEKQPEKLDGYEYVDLGLPSGKCWATKNLGATKESGYGSYNKWSSSDIVSSSWGANWKTPTLTEIRELENYCTWNWTTKDGIYGYNIVGKNNNSIFLPASGYKMVGTSSAKNTGKWVYYWTSTADNYDMAYIIMSTSSDVWYGSMNTSYTMLPIRPITKENIANVIVSPCLSEIEISQVDGIVNIIGLNDGDIIKAYSVSGIALGQYKASGRCVTIDLSAMRGELIILKIGNKIKKIIAK